MKGNALSLPRWHEDVSKQALTGQLELRDSVQHGGAPSMRQRAPRDDVRRPNPGTATE